MMSHIPVGGISQGGSDMTIEQLSQTESARHTGNLHADHAAMGHDAGAMPHDHHDMSDPSMAAAMAVDMRNRFFLSS
jgi:hypothetical protein